MRPARPRFTAAGPGVRVSVDHPGAREGTQAPQQVDTSNALFLTFLSLSTARCDLPGRDLRLLDPVFVYPSTILGRERAMVVNLESIRCIITADEVLLLNVTDPAVQQVGSSRHCRTVCSCSTSLTLPCSRYELCIVDQGCFDSVMGVVVGHGDLESIRCFITADEVFLLNVTDPAVQQVGMP
ncbi:unnamed protein product [Closterium sp. NIES-53]